MFLTYFDTKIIICKMCFGLLVEAKFKEIMSSYLQAICSVYCLLVAAKNRQ